MLSAEAELKMAEQQRHLVLTYLPDISQSGGHASKSKSDNQPGPYWQESVWHRMVGKWQTKAKDLGIEPEFVVIASEITDKKRQKEEFF